MAAPKKSRKELLKKTDEFITFTGRLIRFIADYQKQISYILCAVVAVALVIIGYQFFAQRSEAKAFSMLEKTMAKYEARKKATSADEAYRNVSGEFQRIVEKYGGNAAGKLARVSYANISYNAGDYQKAIELYKPALNDFKDHPLVYNFILSGLGYAYQQMGEDRNAAMYFEKIASTDSNIRDEALFNLGLLYESLGDRDKSYQAFQQILSNFPNSMYFDIVEEKLSGKGLDSSS
ncbi:MAG: tetratricopeptide repeat protein [Desulfobacterales bacterium]|nr:tetratricopeptide repeat protein [Desulfobacterales bacterium]